MVLTREEFIRQFDGILDTTPTAYLWLPETEIVPGPPSEWFVCATPQLCGTEYTQQLEYWAWCNKALENPLRCYYSDTDRKKEWWGFITKADAVMWFLRFN